MAEIHFFIERDKLLKSDGTDPQLGQGPDRAYGPVAGKETEQYRVTSKFQLAADAMAYAVCRGTVFVQPQWDASLGQPSTTLVNLILKPLSSPNNGFTPVAYFIYRGLRRDQFVQTSSELLPENPTNTDFLRRIWKDFKAAVTAGLTTETYPSAERIGLSASPDDPGEPLEKIFFADEDDSSPQIHRQLAAAERGMSLGRFSSETEIGFEVVLGEKFHAPDLAMARAHEYTIALEAPLSASANPGDEPIQRMREREKILNFIDPAAYFMTFYEEGVEYRLEEAAAESKTKSGSLAEIYDLLEPFFTRNRVYIDVRNYLGYSLNYSRDNQGDIGDGEFGKHIRIALTDDASAQAAQLVSTNYYQDFWPVYTLELPPGQNVDHFVLISFRKQYNPEPAIYLDYACAKVENNRPKFPVGGACFIDEPALFANSEWSGAFRIAIPGIPQAGSPGWIAKLFLLRRSQPDQLPPTVIPQNHYLENIFGPLIEEPKFTTNKGVKWKLNPGLRYINALHELGVELIVETSVIFTESRVVILVNPVNFRAEAANFAPADFLKTLEVGAGTSVVAESLEGIAKTYSSIAEFLRYEFKLPSGQSIGILTLKLDSSFKSPDKPFFFGLALQKSEYLNQLLASTGSLSTSLGEVYVHVGDIQEQDSSTYWDMLLALSGVDGTGMYKLVMPGGQTLKGYTVDGRMVSTEGFGV